MEAVCLPEYKYPYPAIEMILIRKNWIIVGTLYNPEEQLYSLKDKPGYLSLYGNETALDEAQVWHGLVDDRNISNVVQSLLGISTKERWRRSRSDHLYEQPSPL